MSEHETLILVAGLCAALISWICWYRALLVPVSLGRPRPGLRLLGMAPAAGLALLWIVLRAFSSFDVKSSLVYLTFYMILGAAWLGLAKTGLAWMGISPRDDVAERGNLAAAYAASGALIGLSLCFAGGNIGDGPGWWVVVFSAGLATLAFYGLWWMVEWLGRVSEAITVERRPDSGVRLGCFLVAQGLILGRSMAGNWVSVNATTWDLFRRGWPALVLALLESAWLVRGRSAPSGMKPALSERAWFAGSVHLLVALVYLVVLGGW